MPTSPTLLSYVADALRESAAGSYMNSEPLKKESGAGHADPRSNTRLRAHS